MVDVNKRGAHLSGLRVSCSCLDPLPDLDNANVGKVIVLPHCNMLVGILQFSFYSERTYHIISPLF